jgi:hypothetical protein
MGGMILADTKNALETGFGITYTNELDIIGMIIGMDFYF